jgi:hypothetical protein
MIRQNMVQMKINSADLNSVLVVSGQLKQQLCSSLQDCQFLALRNPVKCFYAIVEEGIGGRAS